MQVTESPFSCDFIGIWLTFLWFHLRREAQENLKLDKNVFKDQLEFIWSHGKRMSFGVYKLILTLSFFIYYICELEKVTKFSEPQFIHL